MANYDQNSTEEAFISEIEGEFRKFAEARKPWEDMWVDAEQRWILRLKGKSDSWMTDTPTTDTNVAVEGALGEIEDALFGGPTGRYFDVLKQGTNKPLPVVNAVLDMRVNRQINIRKVFNDNYGLRSLLIRGTLIGMVTWKREGRNTVTYEQVIDPMTGVPDYVVKPMFKEDFIDRPDVKLLSLDKIYVEPGIENFADATKIYIEELPRSVVEQQYKIDPKKLDEYPKQNLSESQRGDRRRDLGIPSGSEKQEREMVEVMYVYKWYKPSVIAGISNQQQGDDREGMDTEVTAEAASDVEKLYRVILINRAIIAEAAEPADVINPDPFFIARYIPVDGEIYGIGLPYLLRGHQNALKDLLDLTIDQAKMRLFGIIKYRPNTTASKVLLKIAPNAVWPDFSGNDISMLPMPDVSPSAFNLINLASNKMQETSAVTKTTLGASESSTNKTATGASIMQAQSSKRFRLGIRYIGDHAIVPILERIYALDRQFTTPKQIGNLLGATEAAQWGSLDPNMIFEEAEFRFIHALDIVSEQVQAQNIKDAFISAVQFPWFNAPEALRQWLSKLGVDVSNLVFDSQMLQQAGTQPGMMPTEGQVPQNNNAFGLGRNGKGAPEEFQNPAANG
jgi:hypothetical protein